jgi:membrane fusion protein, multidrug efflux system
MAEKHALTVLGRWASIVLALGALVVLLMWMSGAFHEKVEPGRVAATQPTGPTGGRVVAVREVQVAQEAGAVGSVRARHKTEVASKLLAIIEEIRVKAGDRVKADQVLARLDDRDLQAQLRRAKAVVAAAQADLDMHKSDFDRYRKLREKRAISSQEFERARARHQVSVAQLEQTQQALQEIEVTLTYTNIRSPVAGVVVDRLMEAGDMARPGHPILSVYDPTQLRIEANVRETLAAGLSSGQTLKVRVDAVGMEGEGTIEEIVPQADAASRSLLVKVALPACACKHLYIGMFGRLLIPTGRRQALVVPSEAVARVGQLEFAWIALPDGSRQRRYVKTGDRLGADIEILSGLSLGEQVVVPEREG